MVTVEVTMRNTDAITITVSKDVLVKLDKKLEAMAKKAGLPKASRSAAVGQLIADWVAK